VNTCFDTVCQPQWESLFGNIEFELLVVLDGVENDAGVGLSNIDILQESLDLVVHIVGVIELPDGNNIVIAGRLIHRDHLLLRFKLGGDF